MRSWTDAQVSLVLAAAALSYVVFSCKAPHSDEEAFSQRQPTNAEALVAHRAAAKARGEWEDVANAREHSIAIHGFEPHTAGFHLIRPTDDPLWAAAYGFACPSGGFRWFNVHVHYADVEYQRTIPKDVQPEPNIGACVVSQGRVIANDLCQASIRAQQDGQFSVFVDVPQSSMPTLAETLAPTVRYADGSFVDWFTSARHRGEQPTRFKALLVSDNVGYLFIDVDALVAAAPHGASVTVARDLSSASASALAGMLNAR